MDGSSKDFGSSGREFLNAAADSAVLQPYDGLAQLVDKVSPGLLPRTGRNNDEHETPAIGTADWVARQSGHAVGTAVQVLGLSWLSKRLPFGRASETQIESLRGVPSLAQSAKIGFLMGSVLTPVSDTSENFLTDRLVNGASTGLSLAAFTAASGKLNSSTRQLEGIAGAPGLPVSLGRQIRNDLAGGVVGGLVGAESQSLLAGHGFANGSELFNSATSFALTGGLIGGAGRLSSARAARSKSFLNGAEIESSPIRSTFLTSLTRRQPEIAPRSLAQTVSNLPRSELGLPDKNIDVAAWKGRERTALHEYLQQQAHGAFGGDFATESLVRRFGQSGVMELAQKLRTAHEGGNAPSIEAARTNLQDALTKSISKFTTDRGLPPITVALDAGLPPKVNGMYTPGTGRLVLSEALVKNGITAETIDFISHEGTHFEQDVLNIRNDISEQKTVAGRFPEFVKSVETAPLHGPLSVAERARLDALEQSRIEYGKGPGARGIMQIDQLFRQANSAAQAGQPFAPTEVHELFSARNQFVDSYVGARFESEAWTNGLLAHIKARALGLPAPAKDPTIFSP